jgi:ribonuclease HI
MPSFYAIAKGKIPGVYKSWEEAKKQIEGVKGAKFKKFSSEQEARDFVDGKDLHQQSIEEFFKPVGDPKETEKTLIVFTDGAAKNNSKTNKNAVAAYATVWPYHPELNFGCKLDPTQLQTNNRAEYTALIHALDQADQLDPTRSKTLIVYTDSQFLINSMTLWLLSWKKNGWRKSDGEIVANLDLIQKLDEQTSQRTVLFRHVKAHTGEVTWQAKFNDMVDKLARLHAGTE